MKLIPQNITLENVKKSDYWNLIAILIWNHYSEPERQDESKITITEEWHGVSPSRGVISNNDKWNNPEYSEPGLVRELSAIEIEFARDDYKAYIYIHTDGNIHCFGIYTDKSEKNYPNFDGTNRNLDITNWMMNNNFIAVVD